jgi:putative hydrolase of the HAD superfamily
VLKSSRGREGISSNGCKVEDWNGEDWNGGRREMSTISTVFWDVGGVLLTNGWDHAGRKNVLDYFGMDVEEFERRHPDPCDAWEKDLIDVEEYLAETVFYEARGFTPANFFNQMKAQSVELPDGALRILERMATSSHLELAILNNESRELNDYRLNEFDLTALFDCFFSSCYLGLRKPDEKIYARALDIVQRLPEEVAFIDDRPENVAAAAALGINGIRFQNPAQLMAELDALGIAIAV